MMKDHLEQMFSMTGRDIKNYLDIMPVDPLYRLHFSDGRDFCPSFIDHERTVTEIERLFPGNGEGYKRLIEREGEKYRRLVACLQIPYEKKIHLFKKQLLKAVPRLDLGKSLFDLLKSYFSNDDLCIAFTFQAKYLGMSPWDCPAAFGIIPFIEHQGGVWHVKGGLNQITVAMAKVIKEDGGEIHVNKGVKEVLVKNGRATGVLFEDGTVFESDYVVMGSDFGHSVNNILPKESLKHWTPALLEKKNISCSTFMIYLGIDGIYKDIPHHNVLFSADYKKNVYEIAQSQILSDDPSVYVQNASVMDNTLAPEGKSTLYILVPCPNLRGNVDWEKETPAFREKILDLVENRGGFKDLRSKIETEHIITPKNWEEDMFVYRGATFNLAHNLTQMLMFRPHNRFGEIENLYLAGGGTHPGSGLPTIFESGRISADYLPKL